MKFFLILLLNTITIIAAAQKQTKVDTWQYFGLHQAGLLVGNTTEKGSVLTTNCIAKKNWYTGISTGVDWYGLRTIPLLLSVHKAFGSNRHQPFAYGNAGMGFVWENNFSNRSYSYQYKNGFAGEAGLGYFINLKNKTALSVSAGYSYKQVGMNEKSLFVTDATPFGNFATNEYHYRYHYRRIAIRLGIKI